MSQPLLVVGKSSSKLNKFEQSSFQGAVNIRDFLEQTGEYDEVTIFQLKSVQGPMKEWVAVNEIDA
jgi:hypothetical protein